MWVEEKGIDSWHSGEGGWVVGVIVVVIVAWLALWSFGNDVGGGLVVVMVAWLALWLFGERSWLL